MQATAIDPSEWHKGNRQRFLLHKYTRSGTFEAYVSTCCLDPLPRGENGIFPAARVKVGPLTGAPPEPKIVHVVWRGLQRSSGDWHIYHKNVTAGAPPLLLSTTSVDNDNPWVDNNDIIWSGVDSQGRRSIYYISLSKVGAPPQALNPPQLIDNDYPKVMGVIAAGAPALIATGPLGIVLAGSRDVWVRNIATMDPPNIISSSVSQSNQRHVAISIEHALWAGRNLADTDKRTYWQDLLAPLNPVEVSDQGQNCRASGDVYDCLRAFTCFDAGTDTRQVFFRTVPIVPANPSIVVSTSSSDNQRPKLHGVKMVFLDGNRGLSFIDDLLMFNPLVDSPLMLNDSNSIAIAPTPFDSPEEAEYYISADWVVWPGVAADAQHRLFARHLGNLPASPIIQVSGPETDVSHSFIIENYAVWRGLDPDTSKREVYVVNVADPGTPIRVSDSNTLDNELPKVICTTRAPPPEPKPRTHRWVFTGTAKGGQVSATINGCPITLDTTDKQTAEEVASSFAAKIEADSCVRGKFIIATAFAGTVSMVATGPLGIVVPIPISQTKAYNTVISRHQPRTSRLQ